MGLLRSLCRRFGGRRRWSGGSGLRGWGKEAPSIVESVKNRYEIGMTDGPVCWETTKHNQRQPNTTVRRTTAGRLYQKFTEFYRFCASVGKTLLKVYQI